MKKICLLILVSLLATGPLPAQETGVEVFAPFVSRINVKEENGKAVITWKNSEDVTGYKKIYRYTEEITEGNLSRAEVIARVESGAESYIDAPPASAVFYAILVEDPGNETYLVLIPYRNKTVVGFKIGTGTAAGGKDAEITGLNAQVAGDVITIQFNTSSPSRDLILYRSTKPITSDRDLALAAYSILVKGDSGRVHDSPVAGIDYYYALADAMLVQSGKARFVPGANATRTPVQIPLSQGALGPDGYASRAFPLPAPNILYGVESGRLILPPLPFLLPLDTGLSAKSLSRVTSMTERMTFAKPAMSVEILPREGAGSLTTAASGGEDMALKNLVTEFLADGTYDQALAGLDAYIALPHEKSALSRAHFYRGQARFFLHEYRDALMDFVMAEENQYAETQKWINACFEYLLEKPTE